MNKTKIVKDKLLELQPLTEEDLNLYSVTVSDFNGGLLFSAVYPDFKSANKAFHCSYEKLAKGNDIEDLYES